MRERNPDAADKKPQDVHHRREAARRIVHVFDFLSERPQRQYSQFECLQPERDADNGDAQRYPRQNVFDKNGQPAEKQPDKITQDFHNSSINLYDEDAKVWFFKNRAVNLCLVQDAMGKRIHESLTPRL